MKITMLAIINHLLSCKKIILIPFLKLTYTLKHYLESARNKNTLELQRQIRKLEKWHSSNPWEWIDDRGFSARLTRNNIGQRPLPAIDGTKTRRWIKIYCW